MIKAIFFDIDGTLFSHTTKGIPESTKKALWLLREKGIRLLTATGRHIMDIKNLTTDLPPFDGHITLTGQICLDENEKTVCDAPINDAEARGIIDTFAREGLPLIIIERDRKYTLFMDETIRRTEQDVTALMPEVDRYTGEKVFQLIAFDRENKLETLMKQFPSCKTSRWNPFAVDIISQNGGKVAGIRHFMEHFQIGAHEVMAFGDGENDMEMLRFAGVGVAMGNAAPIVRQQADYVTADIDDAGIYKALQHYGIL